MYEAQFEQPGNSKCLAQLIPLGRYEIILGEKKINYLLKRSTKATLIWLDIKRKTGLTVTIPSSYDMKYLPQYLQNNTRWILKNIERYCSEMLSEPTPTTRPVNTISYLGKCLKVTPRHSACGTCAVKLEKNQLIVSLTNAGLSILELEHWLREQATRIIKIKVKKFAQVMGLFYNRVVIRDQKSRWGSCSCLKNLNFNWRLIMAPEPVLDYVIIHELCHLKEMSHSKSFWKVVAHYCPRWHEYRDWLDSHNAELVAQLSA